MDGSFYTRAPQVLVILGLGTVLGLWLRRWTRREEMAGLVSGTKEVEAFEQRVTRARRVSDSPLVKKVKAVGRLGEWERVKRRG